MNRSESFCGYPAANTTGSSGFLDEDCFDGDWLDLGCGSGALAAAWAESGRTGSYTGVDFSQTLLEEARRLNENISDSRMKLSFFQADLSDSSWVRLFENRKFDGICAFAVLHHMPDASARSRIFRQVYSLLKPLVVFAIRFGNFKIGKMMRRILPWESIGIQLDDVEPGDTLLDWRFTSGCG
jgi:SAM-dependent methyltransferase